MRRLLAIVVVGGVTVSVYLGVAGAGPGNRAATCEVKVSPELRARARDAGVYLAANEQLRFPVKRAALADGGLDFDLPPGLKRFGDDVKVKNWGECSIESCAARPGICALWDDDRPFVRVKDARGCVRRKADAGLGTCLLSDGREPDGFPCSDGCNARPASWYADPTAAGCERVACGVAGGSRALLELDEDAP